MQVDCTCLQVSLVVRWAASAEHVLVRSTASLASICSSNCLGIVPLTPSMPARLPSPHWQSNNQSLPPHLQAPPSCSITPGCGPPKLPTLCETCQFTFFYTKMAKCAHHKANKAMQASNTDIYPHNQCFFYWRNITWPNLGGKLITPKAFLIAKFLSNLTIFHPFEKIFINK
jgi:hypothetical protein